MATKLRKLRITRVDRVWAPANGTETDGPLARIVLAKARTPKANSNHDHSDLAPGERCTGCGYVNPVTKSGGNMPSEQEQLDQLRKQLEDAEAVVEQANAERDEAQAEATELKEQKAEFEAAVEAAEGEADPDEIDKAKLPEAVRKRLEEAEAIAKAAEERVAKIEHEQAAARWLEVAKGLPFVAIAKKVGGDAAADTGALLHSIAKAAGEDAASQLLSVLEMAQERLAKSELLKEKGVNGTGSALGDAGAQLQQAADAIRKAAPNLTAAQAYAQAVTGNPELAMKAQEEDLSHA